MHVMILVAGGAYGMAVLREFDYRHGNLGQCLVEGRSAAFFPCRILWKRFPLEIGEASVEMGCWVS